MADLANTTVRLTVVNPKEEDSPYYEPQEIILENEKANEIYIGRAPGNSVVLDHVAISGTHVRILRQGNEFLLQDLGSRNGTSLNDRKLDKEEHKLLRNGDCIGIVNHIITFHTGFDAFQPQSSENTRQIALDMIQSVLGGSGYDEAPPKVIVMSGVQRGETVELSDAYAEVRVGRDPHRCQLPIHDENISREHCLIRRDWTGVVIRDLNSRNGVVVNGHRVGRNEEYKLSDRDEILLGTVKLSFSDPEGAKFGDQISDVVGDGVLSGGSAEPQKTREPISMPSTPPPAMPAPGGDMAGAEPAPPPATGFDAPEPEDAGAPPMADFGQVNAEVGDGPPPDLPIDAGLTGGQKALIGIVVGVGVSVVLVVMVLLFLS